MAFMKTDIHPQWHDDCIVTCSCGNKFSTGSTKPEIKVEVCSACHPFYTGQQKFIDSLGRVEKFQAKQNAMSGKLVVSKRKKKAIKKAEEMAEDDKRPRNLKEMFDKKK